MKPLRHGDRIGIVSPSSFAAGLFSERFDRGIRQLTELGFEVIVGRNAREIGEYAAGAPEYRAADLNDFFGDQSINAVICAIGGEHSCEIIEFLDFDLISKNPKPLVGYSDISVLLLAIWKVAGFPTFYGPTLMTEFSEVGGMREFSREAFLQSLTTSHPLGVLPASEIIVNEFVSWESDEELTKVRSTVTSDRYEFIRAGNAEGVLICVCIEALNHLKGTRYLPSFENSILFVETASDQPNIPYLAAQLSDFENMGIFECINGMVFGKKGWKEEGISRVKELLLNKTQKYSFPIVYGADFGHISPILTLPIGCEVRLSYENETIEILTSPFV
jgi:muramoyltetrapeptide carboxypeptidase